MASSNSDETQVVKAIHLKVNTDPNASDVVLSWFEELNRPPLRDKVIWWQCQTVLKEGFDNVVEYAHYNLPLDTPIILEAIRSTHQIEIRIWDQGPPFNLKQKLKEMPELEENDADHGRGLKIMEKIANELSYDRTADGRNCLRIVKCY